MTKQGLNIFKSRGEGILTKIRGPELREPGRDFPRPENPNILKRFTDTPDIPEPTRPVGKVHGKNYMWRVWSMRTGAGATVFCSDISGIWLGAKTFAAAPFSVDMEGNLIASSVTISGGTMSGVAIAEYVPYTGATGDVDLGEYGVTALAVTANNGVNIGAGSGITIDPGGLSEVFIQGQDLAIFSMGGGDYEGCLNFTGLSETQTFTFPDHSGNILVDGADVDLGANNIKAAQFIGTTGDFTLWDAVGAGFSFYSDEGITLLGTIYMTDVGKYGLWHPTESMGAILDTTSIATSDKTFTFPNASGTLALTSDVDAILPSVVCNNDETICNNDEMMYN